MTFSQKSLVNLIGAIFLGAINLLIGIILSRVLLPDGMGRYQVVISSVNLMGALAALGVGQATIFYINNKKISPNLVATTSFKFSIAASLISLVILLFALNYEPYFGKIPIIIIFFCALQCVGLTTQNILYPILLAFMQVNKYILTKNLPRIAVLTIVLVVLVFSKINVHIAWIAVAAGHLLGGLLIIYFVRDFIKFNIKFDWTLFKSMVIYGAKLNLNYIVLILNGEVGILLLRFFLATDFEEVGYYSRAIQLSAVLLVISSSLSPLLYSKWSAVDSPQRSFQAERVSRACWAVLILLIGVLELSVGYIIYGLYGAEFLPAVPMMRIILIGIGARFLLTPFFQVFSGSGHPLLTSSVLSLNLIVMAILMFFLVPIYKGVGASIAFTIGNISGMVLGYIIGHIKYGIRIHKSILITFDDIKYITKALLPVRD